MQTKDETGNSGHLKHPSREEWMDWLYGESPRDRWAGLAAHLKTCGYCREEVGRWQGAMKSLNQYPSPPLPTAAGMPRGAFKWGIAAALALGIGFGAGRLASPDAATMRATLKSEILAELGQQAKGQLFEQEKNAAEIRAEDNRLIFAAINKVNEDRLADYLSLHKDLETMAVLTQDSFQQTSQQIVALANSPPPEIKPFEQ